MKDKFKDGEFVIRQTRQHNSTVTLTLTGIFGKDEWCKIQREGNKLIITELDINNKE